MGNGWRIPTYTEWVNVDATAGGNWTNWDGPYNSLLKMHAAGDLKYTTGTIEFRGGTTGNGLYWSGTFFQPTSAWALLFNSSTCSMSIPIKATGISIRCIKD
jgi:uncharacterized protein (TIGR02145 family)